MKKEKQSFGEWFDEAVLQAMTFFAVVTGVIISSVFFGWLGFFLFIGAVVVFWYAKHTGEI